MAQTTGQRSGGQTTELSRWSPFESFSPFAPTFGRLFEDFWGRRSLDDSGLIAPALDVSEDEQGITVSAELPGLKKDDVKIQFENGVLSISGEKTLESEKKGKSFHRMERKYGSLYRAIALPVGANPDKAEAEFTDGVLHVRMPLREEAKPKVVKIK